MKKKYPKQYFVTDLTAAYLAGYCAVWNYNGNRGMGWIYPDDTWHKELPTGKFLKLGVKAGIDNQSEKRGARGF